VLRIVIALIVGVIGGAAVNMGLVILGSAIIPAPAGVDMTDAESIAAGMHLFQSQHFVFPFLAHAAGTLVGAFIAHIIAQSFRNQVAFAVGALSFAGGIAAAIMIPAPVWFVAFDLILAYFPMAFIATRIGFRVRNE